MNFFNFIADYLNRQYTSNKRKNTYKEKDCKVYYDYTWLFKMNLPYAQYIEFEEI